MRVTLAIHTYRYAVRLRQALEKAGIKVWLQDVNTGSEHIDETRVYAGIRVRIQEEDLPSALHLVESGEYLMGAAEAGRSILVPIDFSKRGMRACLVAARLALRANMSVTLLHACPTPYFEGQIPNAIPEVDASGVEDEADMEIEQVKEARTIQQDANAEMKRYLRRMRDYCRKSGMDKLPHITTEVREGIPEEVIASYYSEHSVALVVMSTRDTHTRSSQLIGSVTAEVVDNAKISVLTIPDVPAEDTKPFSKILMFCNLEQEDLLLADCVIRMGRPTVDDMSIVLMPVNERARAIEERTTRLAQALSERYPDCNFSYILPSSSRQLSHDELKSVIVGRKITMVALSNKRRNILSRIFNPGLAHKVLFTNDVPMFALSTSESV